MQTECTPKLFEFEAVERRSVVAGFDGGNITSNAGALLLGQVDRGLGLVRRFADCFIDRRDPRYVEHQVETLVGQRIFGLALGYEDLNDHDELRKDPTFAVLAGKLSPVLRTDCEPLAGKSTLNRLEHTPRRHASKYHKIDCDDAQVDALLVDLFLEAHERAPREIVLDLDNTDIPLHGEQEGRFFHGYYNEYCYLPLYVFCGRHLLLARQRRANVAGSDGAVEEIARIVAQIRQEWPRVRIILRADSGFCNDELMGWCEANRVDYVFGLARNRRLEAALVDQLAEAKRLCAASGQPARVFRDFQYCTIDSWSRTRRVIGKAEHTLEGSNPRFIVTSLKRSRIAYDARALYEKLYCARGEAENRIGEQFELFADRASSATMQPISCACRSRPWPMFWSIPCAASVCAIASSPMPPSRPFASSCSSSGRRCAPACAASTSPSPRDVRTRTSSNSPTSTFSAPSALPEPQDAPKTPGLLIAMLTRALMDSHYGKPKVIARAFREPRQISQPTRSLHTTEMPDNGRVRRPDTFAFEKSRLALCAAGHLPAYRRSSDLPYRRITALLNRARRALQLAPSRSTTSEFFASCAKRSCCYSPTSGYGRTQRHAAVSSPRSPTSVVRRFGDRLLERRGRHPDVPSCSSGSPTTAPPTPPARPLSSLPPSASSPVSLRCKVPRAACRAPVSWHKATSPSHHAKRSSTSDRGATDDEPPF